MGISMKQKSLPCLIRPRSRQGYTLVEILVAAFILVIAVTAILVSYIRCLELNEVSRNSSVGIRAARSKMEEIKSTAFSQIKAGYHGASFNVAGLNGKGVSYVIDTDPTILEIWVSVSWQQKSGRVYGEDNNLNGQINAGEDANANGRLDSPVQIVDYLYNR